MNVYNGVEIGIERTMNAYQKEQFETLSMVKSVLLSITDGERNHLIDLCGEYLAFRKEVEQFLSDFFSGICTKNCFESNVSACCSRDGIITFFGDVLVNALCSNHDEIEMLLSTLSRPNTGMKCVYLSGNGCLWRKKPIVCEMFLCDPAKEEVFGNNPEGKETWETYRKREKYFKWPDRPVLFDKLEDFFLEKGYESSLMYLHNSPGLLRIKEMAKKRKERK